MNEYASGLSCTWHGLLVDTGLRKSGQQVCPHCGGDVKVLLEEEWRAAVALLDRKHPGYAAMMRWGQGRCFPDEETLVNAYRQAMEE